MDWGAALLAAGLGYFLGAVSFSRLASRLLKVDASIGQVEIPVAGTDETYVVTSSGASAASMKLGPAAGCAIGFLDIFKVFLPTLIFRLAFPDQPYYLIAAAAGMVGHNWPVFNRFVGGRGVSAAYGGLLAVDPLGAVVCAVLGLLLGLLVVRDFIIAYLAGLWLIIPWLWFTTHDPALLSYALVINVLFFAAMIPDLRQYRKFRSMGKADMETVMDATPMGRGMLKLMRALRLDRK